MVKHNVIVLMIVLDGFVLVIGTRGTVSLRPTMFPLVKPLHEDPKIALSRIGGCDQGCDSMALISTTAMSSLVVGMRWDPADPRVCETAKMVALAPARRENK
jgi:hypothetical protein